MQRLLEDEILTRVQKLKAYAAELGYGLAEFALAWCLRQKQVSSVIIGATAPDQVQANVKASGIKLDETIWDQAERLLAGQ